MLCSADTMYINGKMWLRRGSSSISQGIVEDNGNEG